MFALLLGFFLGVGIASLVALGIVASFFPAFLGGVLFLYAHFCAEKKRLLYVGAAFLLAFSFGLVRSELSKDAVDPLRAFAGRSVMLEAVVIDEPDVRESGVRLRVRPLTVDGAVVADAPLVLATVDFHERFLYGDRLLLRGTIKRPEDFTNELGRTFRYKAFLAKDGIGYEMYRPRTKYLGGGEGSRLKRFLFALKGEFVSALGRSLPEPESSLAAGLIVGAKQTLGKELLEQFRTVGIIHIVVLSGYNITIIVEGIMRLLGLWLGLRLRLVAGAAGIILFALMTGGSATVVRASLMALLVIIARATGRTYKLTRALLFAGFLMVLHNPAILVFDPSFQLSFLATIGLIYVSPLLKPLFRFLPERFGIQESALSTVGTQIFVLPMILYMTGTLSLVAPLVNLLILPLVPLAMFVGAVGGIVGMISGIVAFPFMLSAHLLLSYMLLVVEGFARLPFAAMTISSFPFAVVAFLYGIYFFLLRRRVRGTVAVVAPCAQDVLSHQQKAPLSSGRFTDA